MRRWEALFLAHSTCLKLRLVGLDQAETQRKRRLVSINFSSGIRTPCIITSYFFKFFKLNIKYTIPYLNDCSIYIKYCAIRVYPFRL